MYIDDILVTGRSEEDHIKNLKLVLTRLQDAGLRLRKNKCLFMKPSVTYLGYQIDKAGIHPVPEKVKAIQDAPPPKNVHELKAYLGLLNYYSKFLQIYHRSYDHCINCSRQTNRGNGRKRRLTHSEHQRIC